MRKFFLYLLPVIGFACIPSFATSPLYLEREIESAIEARDAYYADLRITNFLIPFTDQNTFALDTIRLRLAQAGLEGPYPWFFFLSGLAAGKAAPDSMYRYFSNALSSAGNDPAGVWTLAMEFGRCGQQKWEIQSLEKLEKLFLISGVTASQAIAQPLLEKALSAEKRGDLSAASTYYGWAMTFDRSLFWPFVRKMASAFPSRPSEAITAANALADQTAESWRMQASLALQGTLWLRWCLIIFCFGVMLVLGILHLPSGIHWLTEIFPSSMPQKMKLIISLVCFFSLISFGVLPFLWLVILTIWRYCSKRDAWLATLGCLLLLLYPLAIRTEDMLRQCLSPLSTPSLFYRAMSEGYDPDLDVVIRNNVSRDPHDYLAYTASALYAVKNNDLAHASLAIQRAALLRRDDQAVLISDGIISYLSGNFERAKASFETCTKLFPDYEPGFFNLGQYYLGSNETFKGMDYLDRATKLNQEKVNAFIKTNDDFFSKKWPRMRQFMPPDYQSGYFWKNVFPRYWGTWNTADILWGNAFFGIRSSWYALFAAITFVTLLFFSGFVWSSRSAVKIFLCKLCGASMCRQCKKGMVCVSCFQALQQIRNENIRQSIIERIILKNLRLRQWSAYCLDVIFPGCGMLYRRGDSAMIALFFIMLTSAGYATLLSLHGIGFAYPCQASRDLLPPLYYTLPLYNVAFAVRAFIKINKGKRT